MVAVGYRFGLGSVASGYYLTSKNVVHRVRSPVVAHTLTIIYKPGGPRRRQIISDSRKGWTKLSTSGGHSRGKAEDCCIGFCSTVCRRIDVARTLVSSTSSRPNREYGRYRWRLPCIIRQAGSAGFCADFSSSLMVRSGLTAS